MIKKYHVSKQLFDKDNTTVYQAYINQFGDWTWSADSASIKIPCNANTQYTLSIPSSLSVFRIYEYSDASILPENTSSVTYQLTEIIRGQNLSEYTFTTSSTTAVIVFQGSKASQDEWFNGLMLNTGSTALPYEPYGDSFKNWFYREYGTETETFTTLPHEVIGDGTAISAYTIKGNMSQSGTPTPSNPIYPTEVGDKTANLFNVTVEQGSITSSGDIEASNRVRTRGYIDVPTGDIAISWNSSQNTDLYIMTYNASETYINGLGWKTSPTTITISGNVAKIRLIWRYNSQADITPSAITNVMINEGSTAQSYEPYGYKIPISFGQGTYTNYLSEPIRKIGTAVDSMASTGTANRVIKKWTLTGTENFEWKKSTAYSGGFYTSWHNSFGGIQNGQFYCSHAQYVSDITDYQQNTCYSDGSCNIRIMQSSSTVQDWIDYLSQQYAAGTPVTVWYVLETATTETFTAPSIPTSGSPQSFDVSTTLKPSEVSLTYHGWHEHEDTKFTT